MTAPVVSQAAREVYDLAAPLVDGDEANGWAALILCEALVRPLQEVAAVFQGRGDLDPWDPLWLVDEAPEFALPWLAQFHGVRLPPGVTGDQARDFIRDAGGLNRGTDRAIRAAVRVTLTGTRRVTVYPRYGAPTGVLVVTYTGETPDPVAAEGAARDALPAGYQLTYEVRTGQDYQTAQAAKATYAEWLADWVTYQNVKDAN